MPHDDLLTDDYVAGLLAQEANDCSLKYSTMGMESNKKPASMPKPNKRFLRHIIKDTDSHNRALLAKEASESRARLRDLERAEETRRRKTNPDACDIRRRQMGDIQAILGGRKQPREEGNSRDENSETRPRQDERRRHRRRRSESREKTENDRHDRHRRERSSERHSAKRHRSTERQEKKRRRTRHDDTSPEDDRHRHRYSKSRRERSRSPRRRRTSCSPTTDANHRRRSRHRSPLKSRGRSPQGPKEGQPDDPRSDSDPLNDLIGPAPPPKHRGRGTIGGALNLDRRFSDSYDPRADVQPDDVESDDWDEAVETYRDRQMLRLNQAQRMRAAGFTDKQIKRMEDGGEKSEKDVVWSKAGEKRAWDQGKDLDNSPTHPPTLFSEDY
ncbi:hypothetical protein HIM_01524 [Hirsutella minnesotensis 3608]|nr:hypothetical protein HIM_01524 [Hirsutella minnesotensis 3608]